MTRETRTTIELGDIAAIEFECTQCHSRTTRLLDKWNQSPASCGNCGEQWMLTHSGDFKSIDTLANLIRTFSSHAMPFTMRLEIKPDGTEESKT
jgi:hypothetical protein